MKITFAITVCNEVKEFSKLLEYLENNKQSQDEILVVWDITNTTNEMKLLMDDVKEKYKVIPTQLNNDFASFKNNIIEYSTGGYIFQIDADEIPNGYLMNSLHHILEDCERQGIEILHVARYNSVKGITLEHIQKWGWHVKEGKDIDMADFETQRIQDYFNLSSKKEPMINWPDFQARIFVNNGIIKWEGKVHETLTGLTSIAASAGLEGVYHLIHEKEIQRQEQQNQLYDSILQS